ncbi:MAG: histidine kinase [Clostridia bacterium]|nr:histidine kinase [Clostridia bacterium]
MVSYTKARFYLNASLMIIAAMFTTITFISCLLKERQIRTKAPFCILTLDIILMLLCNYFIWLFGGMGVSQTNRQELFGLNYTITVFDFFFYCIASTFFYNYIVTLVSGREDNKKTRLTIIHTLIIICFVITFVFADSIYSERFNGFNGEGKFLTTTYWVMIAVSAPSIWMSFFAIIINRKSLGLRKTAFLLSYLFLPMALVFVDRIFGLPISYIGFALIDAIIYVGVDLEQDRELLRKEAIIAKQETENTEMKVNLMMSQIQPHFLYNTLSTIAYLCRKDPQDAENAVNEFSDYLAGNLRSINTTLPILFETELNHVENYLKIQKRRFPDRINVEYNIGAQNFLIPALTLQPIVENAVRHAVETRIEMTTITISSKETENEYLVSVKDDGPGFDVTKRNNDDRPHIGIASARSRLDRMVGGRLEIKSEAGKGTAVTFIIPKNTEVIGE